MVNEKLPLKNDATFQDAFERFQEVTGINQNMISDYRPACQPFLNTFGLRIQYVNYSIIIFLKNGEKIIYQYNINKETDNETKNT